MDGQSEEYLTVEELSRKIKFSKQSIYNMIHKEVFVRNIHYIKPRPKKILFKWSVIHEWLEPLPDQDTPLACPQVSKTAPEHPVKSLINI